jgi:hypothetical protein
VHRVAAPFHSAGCVDAQQHLPPPHAGTAVSPPMVRATSVPSRTLLCGPGEGAPNRRVSAAAAILGDEARRPRSKSPPCVQQKARIPQNSTQNRH